MVLVKDGWIRYLGKDLPAKSEFIYPVLVYFLWNLVALSYHIQESDNKHGERSKSGFSLKLQGVTLTLGNKFWVQSDQA